MVGYLPSFGNVSWPGSQRPRLCICRSSWCVVSSCAIERLKWSILFWLRLRNITAFPSMVRDLAVFGCPLNSLSSISLKFSFEITSIKWGGRYEKKNGLIYIWKWIIILFEVKLYSGIRIHKMKFHNLLIYIYILKNDIQDKDVKSLEKGPYNPLRDDISPWIGIIH